MTASTAARAAAALAGFGAGFLALHLALPERVAADAGEPEAAPPSVAGAAGGAVPAGDRPRPLAPAAPLEAPPAGDSSAGAPEDRGPATPRRGDGDAPAPSHDPAPLGVSLVGLVHWADGRPAEGASLVTQLDGGWSRARSDAAGRYALGPLDPGPRLVMVSASGSASHDVTLTLPEGDATYRHDFELTAERRVTVRAVTPAGDGLTSALEGRQHFPPLPIATLERLEGPVERERAWNRDFGIGTFDRGLDPGDGTLGTLAIRESGPCWIALLAGSTVVASERVGADATSITFTVDPTRFEFEHGSLSGRLVAAETGAPLAGSFQLQHSRDPWRSGDPTEEDGTFRVDEVTPGERFLVVGAPERARVTRTVAIEAGRHVALGDVALPAARVLAGRLERADGSPIAAGVNFGALDEETGEATWNDSWRSWQEPGSFRFEGLEPRRYAVRAVDFNSRARSVTEYVDLTLGSVEDARLVLIEPVVVVFVLPSLDEPLPRLALTDGDGSALRERTLGEYGFESQVSLLPGNYHWVVTRGGEELAAGDLTAVDEPLRIELAFD